MQVEIYQQTPDGPQQLFRGPMVSAQPLLSDKLHFTQPDKVVIFEVHDRAFVYTANEDGGGVTVALHVSVHLLGAMPVPGYEPPESGADEESTQERGDRSDAV